VSQVIGLTIIFYLSRLVLAFQDFKAQNVHIIPYVIALLSGGLLCMMTPDSTFHGVSFVLFSLVLFFSLYKKFPTALADVPYWLITTYLLQDQWVYSIVMIAILMMIWAKFSKQQTLPFIAIVYVCFLFLKFPLS